MNIRRLVILTLLVLCALPTTSRAQYRYTFRDSLGLYKVEFNAPSIEAKRAIWKSMIPSLGEEEAMLLATKYEFSGGQIENIARKYTVAQILSVNDITLNDIHDLCREERLDKERTHRRIGF